MDLFKVEQLEKGDGLRMPHLALAQDTGFLRTQPTASLGGISCVYDGLHAICPLQTWLFEHLTHSWWGYFGRWNHLSFSGGSGSLGKPLGFCSPCSSSYPAKAGNSCIPAVLLLPKVAFHCTLTSMISAKYPPHCFLPGIGPSNKKNNQEEGKGSPQPSRDAMETRKRLSSVY